MFYMGPLDRSGRCAHCGCHPLRAPGHSDRQGGSRTLHDSSLDLIKVGKFLVTNPKIIKHRPSNTIQYPIHIILPLQQIPDPPLAHHPLLIIVRRAPEGLGNTDGYQL